MSYFYVSRKLLITLLAVLAAFAAEAQKPWNPTSVDEAYNDRAYMLQPNADGMDLLTKTAKIYRDGRYQRMTPSQVDSIAFGRIFIPTGPYVIGRVEHLRLQSDSNDFYIPVADATTLLPYLVSTQYWNDYFRSLARYAYIDEWNLADLLDADSSGLRCERYCRLEWLSFDYQPSFVCPVVFTVRTNTGEAQQLTLTALQQLENWGAMTETATVEAYEQAIALAREMRDEADRRMRNEEDSLHDGNLFPAVVLRDLLAINVDETELAQITAGSKVLLYAYTDTIGERDCFYGRFRNVSYKFAYGDLRFASQDDVAYLMRRGRNGLNTRLMVASRADSVSTERYADSLAKAHAQMREQIEQTKRDMDRRQIFLMNIKLAQSDYQFGLEFNFYNCFNKTIRKIEMQVTAYNAAGAVQRDKFDRRMRDIRCMGPIPPQSPAQYTFDELFWDDNGRIRYLRLTYIKFTFADGTTRSYNGHEAILSHTLNQ